MRCAPAELGQRWGASGHAIGLEERGGPWIELGRHQARFLEGVRVPAPEARELGLFGPAAIRDLLFHDDTPPARVATDLPTVAPGDVVLSKFLPARVAWVRSVPARRSRHSPGLARTVEGR